MRSPPSSASAPARLAWLVGLALIAGLPRPGAAAPAYGREPPVEVSEVEQEALELARARLSGRGAAPEISSALVVAARALAAEAAAGRDALGRRALRNALAGAPAHDAAPTVYVARGTPGAWGEVLAGALEPGAAATHVGAGAAQAGDVIVVVVLTSRRGARLDPFPRAVAVGQQVKLSGQLRSGLCDPRIFLTLPSGQVRRIRSRGRVWFEASVRFEAPGRHVLEVLAEGPQGPTVAALLPVAAGETSFQEPEPEPAADNPADDEAAVVAAIAALRARHGLAPLRLDPALSAVARRHSEAMRKAGAIAHALPGEPGPTDRLARAGIRYRAVFENVAAATTATEAHAAAEESPAHRQNLLQPRARRLGVGLAGERAPEGGRVYLTELLVE